LSLFSRVALYDVRLFVHGESSTSLAGQPVAAEVVGSHVEVSPAAVAQFGTGSAVSFLITTQRKFSAEVVGLNFCLQNAAGTGSEKVQTGCAPEFQLRAELTPPRLFWFWTISLFAFSTILLNVMSDTVQDFLSMFLDSKSMPSKETVVFIALITKAAGGLCIGGASYYALRKMPVGGK